MGWGDGRRVGMGWNGRGVEIGGEKGWLRKRRRGRRAVGERDEIMVSEERQKVRRKRKRERRRAGEQGDAVRAEQCAGWKA